MIGFALIYRLGGRISEICLSCVVPLLSSRPSSPHNPPHEQLLVRLGVGGVSLYPLSLPLPLPHLVSFVVGPSFIVGLSFPCRPLILSLSPCSSPCPAHCPLIIVLVIMPPVVVWGRHRPCSRSFVVPLAPRCLVLPCSSSLLAPAVHPASNCSQRWGRVLSAGCRVPWSSHHQCCCHWCP